MNYSDLGLDIEIKEVEVEVAGGKKLNVLTYLPMKDKTEMLQFIVNNVIDPKTGCASPIRMEIYFSIAMCHWYGGIGFSDEDMAKISDVYDALEVNKVIQTIIDYVPYDEINFMRELAEETVADVARYNSSAAGIIQSMADSSGSLDEQLSDIIKKVQSREGLEMLDMIKNEGKKD